jgi:hypothetical protein
MQDGLVFLVLKAHLVQLISSDFLDIAITLEIPEIIFCDDTLSSHQCPIPGKQSRVASQLVLS